MVPLPIIRVPFEMIGVDLVGTLEYSMARNKRILVILDYATWYPKVISFQSATAAIIQKASEGIFLGGDPQRDTNGLGNHLHLTINEGAVWPAKGQVFENISIPPSNQQINGAFQQDVEVHVEDVCSQWSWHLDCLFPRLLFTIHEVPQTSSVFSPFELLYGRQPPESYGPPSRDVGGTGFQGN